MNIVLKNIKKILQEKRLIKIQKNILEKIKNLQKMLGENDFYKLLFKNYPKLESLTELQLLDKFETHELLEEIFGKNEK